MLSGSRLQAQTHSTLHSFGNDQGLPIARLLEASDGKLYGTTFTGGVYGQGSVYALDPDGLGGFTFSTLVSFSGGAEGGYLAAPLIEASDGDFYGTARAGGGQGFGTIFRVNGAGQVTTVHSFSGPEGGEPSAGLVEGPGGILFGTASRGGADGYGTAFRVELSGDGFAVLHDFSEREGFPDMGGLVLGSNGRLYGTCYAPTLDGLVFSMAAAGDWRVEHTFFGDDGESPEGGLVEGDDGLFYGTTFGGGSAGLGTFYSMDPSGAFTVIRSFDTGDIVYPGRLWQAGDGSFYGASWNGGAALKGTVYRLTAAGDLAVLHDFDGQDGGSPVGGLMEAADGFFYGATEFGGPAGYGVVYRIKSTGEFEVLHAFVNDGGTHPACELVEWPAGTFYGTTGDGGAFGRGTAFSSDVAGQVTLLHDFTAPEGSYPAQGLIEAPDGFFYGVAMAEGSDSHGTFFRMDTAGFVTVLHHFTEAEGGAPFHIVLASDGAFYGSNAASVVKLQTSGTLTALHPVPGFPYVLDRVMQGSDGDLYGTTFYGGALNFGTVFRLTTDGATFTTLHEFTATEGAFPVGTLVEASDGKFYGSTNEGGLNGAGVLFRIGTSGQYEMLHSFGTLASGDGVFGATLIEASNGYLYGTNGAGGSFGLGTVFRLDTAGEETVVHSFGSGGSDGEGPNGALLEASDGLLYGSTINGGLYGGGTLFHVDPAATLPVFSVTPASGPPSGGTSVVITGESFAPGATVRIGTAPAIAAATLGAAEIQVTTPFLSGGTLNHVFVTNPDGTEGSLSRAWFSDFYDLPQEDPAHGFVEKIFRAGVTAGCGGGTYCRFADLTRAQMAVFLLRTLLGSRYYPPPATGTVFADVAADSFAAAWIEDLASRGITVGCGDGLYCPTATVRRSQMAVFLLKTLLGSSYVPPPATGTVFADVPPDSFAADWIEDLATRGIAAGCLVDPARYCPMSPTNRAQMAIFLVKTFDLP